MKFLSTLTGKPDFKRYFLYALLIKGAFFLLVAFLFNKNAGSGDNVNYIFRYSSDYHSYIDPAVNCVDSGEYFEADEGKKLYAHKMPGMLPIFAPLYYVFGLSWGLTLLVILQYITDALCCVLLGKVALKIFKDSRAFYLAFYLYAFSSVVSVTSHNAISELFCTSFLIISIYFALEGRKKKNFFFAGLFAAWSVFFRPLSILLFVFLPFLMEAEGEEKSLIKRIKFNRINIAIFLVPFIIAESAWILRNSLTLKRFIPHDICIENAAPIGTLHVFEFVKAIGGDLQSWNPGSEICWINGETDISQPGSYPFPAYVEKGGVSKVDLLGLRNAYKEYQKHFFDPVEAARCEEELYTRCQGLIAKFKANAPFSYYVVAPLRVVKTLVFIKRPYGITFKNNDLPEKIVRAWHFFCYYFPIVFLIISIFLFRQMNRDAFILLLYVLIHVLLYGFVFRYSENRYLVPIHPLLILISAGTLIYLFSFFGKRKADRSGYAGKDPV